MILQNGLDGVAVFGGVSAIESRFLTLVQKDYLESLICQYRKVACVRWGLLLEDALRCPL